MRGFSQGITTLAALLASTSTTALAQEASDGANNDDEIVVTAQRREQSLLDVPLAVSALGGDDLAQKGIDNSSELAAAVPNLQINSPFGNTQPNFSLRGIGVANEYNSNQASPVGVYIDDVYLAPRTSHGMGLFDLDRIAAMVVYIIGEAVGHDIELEILPAARANHRIKVFLEEMKLLARRKALTNELNVLEGDITYEQELVAHYLDEYVTPHRKTLARLKREADKLRKQLNG